MTNEDTIFLLLELKSKKEDFLNSSEPSNASTSVVNAPREPYVVKQDNGSFVDKIIFRAPDSPDQFHCFHCKDVLRAGEAYKRCTCAKCGSGLGKGLCYIFGHNQNSLNDSPSISETSSQSPPNINHCCYECGDPLDGIFCKRCTCKSCGKDAHIGYNCPSKVQLNNTLAKIKDQMTSITSLCKLACQVAQKKLEEKQIEEERAAKAKYWKLPVCYDDEERSDSLDDNIISRLPLFSAITPDEPVLSTEEPDNSLSKGDEHLNTIPAMESDEFIKSGVKNLIPILSESEGIPEHVCDVPSHDNSPPLDVSTDQIEDFSKSNKVFSPIDDDSFSIDDINYVEASPPDSELVSSEVMEIVILEVRGIDDDILLMIEHDILREKLLNVNLLISKIEALNANPTPSSDCKTKSSSTSLTSLLEETNTFDNSLPEFKTFYFDVEEISSGSTTTPPDISLPEYEAFHDDHVKEISSGSPTTHSDSPLYASFMFDLSINPFPPADRSDSYEFTNELIPFISAPEYDCFRFTVEPNLRDFTKDVVEDISPTKEP
nr:hypothetical protein [Tanacetum cinerariifolium]